MNEGFNAALERINWRDAGCDLHPACLQCPLPKCIEEEPRGRQKKRLGARAGAMQEMKSQGQTTGQIAGHFALSLRSVQRALRNSGTEKIQKPNTKIQTIIKL